MSSPAAENRHWSIKAISLGTVIAVVLIVLAILGTRTGIWKFELGFLFMAAATLLALIGLFGGVVAIIISIKKAESAGRNSLLGSTLVCFLILGVMFAQYQAASSVPPIHNISTDQQDPPQFDQILKLRRDSNPVEYDVATLGEQQSAAYPQVKPLATQLDVQSSLRRSVEVLENMGLEIVSADFDANRIEATATSLLFGFKDDLVVRVRETEAGSVIDLHSVSRVGQSDLGMNAKRIMAFTAAF